MPKQASAAVAAVGVDVAKATLSVCLRAPDGAGRALSLRNTEADVRRRLLPRLAGFSGRIVMESTGHYHWAAALALSEAGLDVRVVNPILAKQYTSANVRKVKTDPADAAGLARMAHLADGLPPSFALDRKALNLRKKLSVLSAVDGQLQALRASLRHLKEAREAVGAPASPAEASLAEAARGLESSAAELRAEFVEGASALSDPAAAAALDSIPGVTPFVALLALHWFARLPGADAKSWVAFAGLDVSSRESGTWRGRCRLTKRGNPFLRRRLYSAAWGAVMCDGGFRASYGRMREAGRPHVEALTILSRKIVRIMFRLSGTREKYDPTAAGLAEAA